MPSNENALRVFVVDDDPLVLAVTRRVLMRAGYEAAIFDDPRPALVAIERDPPFAVVADLNMPDLSGSELLAEVKQRAPHSLRVLYTGEDTALELEPGLVHAVLAKAGVMQSLPDTLARLRIEVR
ncbi:MAG TPA: response regulator [Polyangiales bacterium]|nr:response regulator [Polyangiales bacterium]